MMYRTYKAVKTKSVCYNIDKTVLENLHNFTKNKISKSFFVEEAIIEYIDYMKNIKTLPPELKRVYGKSNIDRTRYSIDEKVLETLYLFTHQSFDMKLSMSLIVELAITKHINKCSQ